MGSAEARVAAARERAALGVPGARRLKVSRGRLLERLYGLTLPSQIKAVGLTRQDGQAAFLVVTDTFGDTAGAVTAQASELFPELGDVPVVTLEVPGRFRAAAYLPGAQADALTPEQEVLEPVVLGAQVQNGSAEEAHIALIAPLLQEAAQLLATDGSLVRQLRREDGGFWRGLLG